MWVEIATAGVVVGLVGIIVRFQAGRIKAVEDKLKCKVDGKVCNIHYDELKEDLKQGRESFKEIINEQKTISETLIRLDERMTLVLDKTHN